MSAPLLQVTGLQKYYGDFRALGGVDLAVEPGEVRGLIGPNGSGKSTLLRTIAGEYQPNGGSIRFAGRDVTRLSAAERARLGIALKFQITAIFPDLTVYENLFLATQPKTRLWSLVRSRTRAALQARTEELLALFQLEPRASDPAGILSHGEQQWLEIGMALACEPRLLLLDEPTAGMSPDERRYTGRLLRRLSGTCAIVFVEHDIDFVKDFCDTLSVLHLGEILDEGTPAIIESSEKVREIYVTGGRGHHG